MLNLASDGGGKAGLQKILGNAFVMVKGDPTGEVRKTNDFADDGEDTSDIIADVGGA